MPPTSRRARLPLRAVFTSRSKCSTMSLRRVHHRVDLRRREMATCHACEISSLPSVRRRASRWRSHDSSTSGRRSVVCGAERTSEVEHDHPPVTRVEHVSFIAIGVEQQLREHLMRCRSRTIASVCPPVVRAFVRSRSASSISTSSTHHESAPGFPGSWRSIVGRHHRVERQQPRQFPGRDVVAVRVHEAELASALFPSRISCNEDFSSTLWNAASCVSCPSLSVSRSAPVMPLPMGRDATTFALFRKASCCSTGERRLDSRGVAALSRASTATRAQRRGRADWRITPA